MVQDTKIGSFIEKYNFVKTMRVFSSMKRYLKMKISLKKRYDEFQAYSTARMIKNTTIFSNPV